MYQSQNSRYSSDDSADPALAQKINIFCLLIIVTILPFRLLGSSVVSSDLTIIFLLSSSATLCGNRERIVSD